MKAPINIQTKMVLFKTYNKYNLIESLVFDNNSFTQEFSFLIVITWDRDTQSVSKSRSWDKIIL